MAKQEVLNVIKKRLKKVEIRENEKAKLKLFKDNKAQIKVLTEINKKFKKLNVKKTAVQKEINELANGKFRIANEKLKKDSKNSLSFDCLGYAKPYMNKTPKGTFNLNEEFDKIEEELILSEDESGTLKEILERIAEM